MKLLTIRESRGLSQSQLAERAGLSVTYIKILEEGKKSPTVRTLEKLAAALGISVADLLIDDQAKAATK